MNARSGKQLIVVSNRLPVSVGIDDRGRRRLQASSGGLVSALAPALRAHGGVWIGWPGGEGTVDVDDELALVGEKQGYELRPVHLDESERNGFYYGFSNEIIWPLFHDFQSLCNFDPQYWQAYESANWRYARAIIEVADRARLVWVHDYHLIGTGERVRALDAQVPIAFFLHIPFPCPDIYVKFPWRLQVLRSLLAYDLVGFQTPRDRRNFLDCIRLLLPEAELSGRGQPVVKVHFEGREVSVGRFPIGVDYKSLASTAADPEVIRRAEALQGLLPDRQLLLGVDRLDYSKGIPERLLAFADALDRYPDLRKQVTLIQVVVPSREQIPRYFELKDRIDKLVGEINGRFTEPGGWVPIHYIFRNLERKDLLAYYRAARIALVTPHKDGMNLVAKEFCACSADNEGVLVLSEFAGVAAEMRDAALLVNPYAIQEVADAIHRAFSMSPAESKARMRRLRREVRRHDVFWWIDTFLGAALRDDPSSFPQPRDHVHVDHSEASVIEYL